MGSGSTGEAALKCGRRFMGIEYEKEYFEMTKKDWKKYRVFLKDRSNG